VSGSWFPFVTFVLHIIEPSHAALQVAEGVATAGAVIALARKYRVSMPVLTAVARILENELTPKKAVLELMSLPQVEEV
jgi:glycerol-3-phosphate dehydrogenase (NAD+)